ncbi:MULTISPECIES: YaaC family protein [Rhodospirillales]|uniref:YaaC family protein n=1 Tax=Rhodospirillales TaxID=204441 RepID=UPI003AA7BF24
MHKSVKQANFETESVLSNDPWLFVELWLKRKKNANALSYWLQARRFSEAASNMSVEAAPLTLYYSFLNATKALLEMNGTLHGSHHGVSGDRPEKAKASLANEHVQFKDGGVLPALCRYLGDSTPGTSYNLKQLLWNLPYVHRAFRHTFTSSTELFIPLESACYVSPQNNSNGWFQARVVPRYADGRTLRSLPRSFEHFEHTDGCTYIRRKKRFRWYQGRARKEIKLNAIKRLVSYHSKTRRVIVTISGSRDLWYIKKYHKDNIVAERHGLAIIFAAMHRMSELVRYDPNGFERHLMGNANWLISEFVEHSSSQFIDQIASEITGLQFWRPGIRP